MIPFKKTSRQKLPLLILLLGAMTRQIAATEVVEQPQHEALQHQHDKTESILNGPGDGRKSEHVEASHKEQDFDAPLDNESEHTNLEANNVRLDINNYHNNELEVNQHELNNLDKQAQQFGSINWTKVGAKASKLAMYTTIVGIGYTFIGNKLGLFSALRQQTLTPIVDQRNQVVEREPVAQAGSTVLGTVISTGIALGSTIRSWWRNRHNPTEEVVEKSADFINNFSNSVMDAMSSDIDTSFFSWETLKKAGSAVQNVTVQDAVKAIKSAPKVVWESANKAAEVKPEEVSWWNFIDAGWSKCTKPVRAGILIGGVAVMGYAVYQTYKNWDYLKEKIFGAPSLMKKAAMACLAAAGTAVVCKAGGVSTTVTNPIITISLSAAASCLIGDYIYKHIAPYVYKGLTYIVQWFIDTFIASKETQKQWRENLQHSPENLDRVNRAVGILEHFGVGNDIRRTEETTFEIPREVAAQENPTEEQIFEIARRNGSTFNEANEAHRQAYQQIQGGGGNNNRAPSNNPSGNGGPRNNRDSIFVRAPRTTLEEDPFAKLIAGTLTALGVFYANLCTFHFGLKRIASWACYMLPMFIFRRVMAYYKDKEKNKQPPMAPQQLKQEAPELQACKAVVRAKRVRKGDRLGDRAVEGFKRVFEVIWDIVFHKETGVEAS